MTNLICKTWVPTTISIVFIFLHVSFFLLLLIVQTSLFLLLNHYFFFLMTISFFNFTYSFRNLNLISSLNSYSLNFLHLYFHCTFTLTALLLNILEASNFTIYSLDKYLMRFIKKKKP